jgi:hypothetical protein
VGKYYFKKRVWLGITALSSWPWRPGRAATNAPRVVSGLPGLDPRAASCLAGPAPPSNGALQNSAIADAARRSSGDAATTAKTGPQNGRRKTPSAEKKLG